MPKPNKTVKAAGWEAKFIKMLGGGVAVQGVNEAQGVGRVEVWGVQEGRLPEECPAFIRKALGISFLENVG